MNDEALKTPDIGYCHTNNAGDCGYNVPIDQYGNNVLTGDGKGKDEKTFTCEALEVYQIQ